MRSALVTGFLFLTARLPLPLAHVLGVMIGVALLLIPNKTRHIAWLNISFCYAEWSFGRRAMLLVKTLIETAKTGAEVGMLWRASGKAILSLVKTVKNEALLKQALAQGNGVILAVPHLGAWELLGQYISTHYKMTSMYRPPRMQALEGLVRSARERMGAQLVPADNSGIRQLYKALGNNTLVAILPDQEPGKGKGVFAPFFAKAAYTTVLLPRLAKRTQAPVILAYARRLSFGRGFELIFQAANLNPQMTIEQACAVVNAGIEDCIHHCPAQYQWGYKRFKTRPLGEPSVY